MFVMHRLIHVVENQLAKNFRRKFNIRDKIQHTKNLKNCKLERGEEVACLSGQINYTSHGSLARQATCSRLPRDHAGN